MRRARTGSGFRDRAVGKRGIASLLLCAAFMLGSGVSAFAHPHVCIDGRLTISFGKGMADKVAFNILHVDDVTVQAGAGVSCNLSIQKTRVKPQRPGQYMPDQLVVRFKESLS